MTASTSNAVDAIESSGCNAAIPHLHLLREQIAIEGLSERVDQANVQLQPRAVATLDDVQIRHNATGFRIQKEGVSALPGGQARLGFLTVSLIAQQVVEKPESVLSGQFQHAALRQVHHAAAFADGGILGGRLAERADDLDVAVRLKLRLRLAVNVLQGVVRHGLL